MKLTPGLDLSAAEQVNWDVDAWASPEKDIEAMRKASESLEIGDASALARSYVTHMMSAEEERRIPWSDFPKVVRRGIPFTNSFIRARCERQAFSPQSLHIINNARERAVTGVRVTDEVGTSIAYEVLGLNGDVAGVAILDRALSAQDRGKTRKVAYAATLSYLDTSDGSLPDMELPSYAMATVASWQIHNDLLILTDSLAAGDLRSKLSVALVSAADGISSVMAQEVEDYVWSIMSCWSEWIPNGKGLVTPSKLFSFGENVSLAADEGTQAH